MRRLSCICLLVIVLPGGCGTDASCPPGTKPPAIDWQDIDARMQMAADVGNHEGLTDEQLAELYSTNKIVAIVRRPSPETTRYLLLVHKSWKRQHIVLTGTDTKNIKDVLADLNVNPVMDPELGVEFHSGFFDLAQEVRADVEPLLNHTYSTRITGFSLGGAIAAILSLHLAADGFPLDSVVTFGQPKVTMSTNAPIFADIPLMRFIAAHDGVPTLFSTHPYVHFGDEIIMLDGPHIVFMTPDDVNYSLSTNPPVDSPDGTVNFDDHGTYLPRIASKLQQRIIDVSFCALDQYINGG